jgi:hypothetical protein
MNFFVLKSPQLFIKLKAFENLDYTCEKIKDKQPERIQTCYNLTKISDYSIEYLIDDLLF